MLFRSNLRAAAPHLNLADLLPIFRQFLLGMLTKAEMKIEPDACLKFYLTEACDQQGSSVYFDEESWFVDFFPEGLPVSTAKSAYNLLKESQ